MPDARGSIGTCHCAAVGVCTVHRKTDTLKKSSAAIFQRGSTAGSDCMVRQEISVGNHRTSVATVQWPASALRPVVAKGDAGKGGAAMHDAHCAALVHRYD